MKFKVIRIYQTFYRPLSGKLMAGFGYHLNGYFNIVDPNAEQGLPSPFLDYHSGQIVTHGAFLRTLGEPGDRQPRQSDLRDATATTR